MRLTKKDKDGNYYTTGEDIGKAYPKLGQLEDIEDSLGMPLTTFFRILYKLDKNQFTFCQYSKDKEFLFTAITPVPFCVDLHKKEFTELKRPKGYEQHLKFKDYGKTWALTKEELLWD